MQITQMEQLSATHKKAGHRLRENSDKTKDETKDSIQSMNYISTL